MAVTLYNTLTRRQESFKPRVPGQVGLYTCGPTVYAAAHIGNLRTYVFEDVLRRVLAFNGLNVHHVMNVTDVGHLTGDTDDGADKMEESARRAKKSALDIAAEFTTRFFNDTAALNILPPTSVLYATKTIDLQQALITKLIGAGVTYQTADGIYFDTSKFPRYGQLSGQSMAEKKAGARVEVNDEKKHPSDFALWKFSKPEDQRQMEWPSPWGTGFPGWHLECSAMSMHELGEQFDIHTGGVDHIAVHHENEIAQSEAATGKHPFVNIWMHGEFLIMPDKRMGKSEGNAITLADLVDAGIDPLAYRYVCLQSHYRKPLTYSIEAINAGQTSLNRLWSFLASAPAAAEPDAAYVEKFRTAINDDLNTSKAIGIMFDLLDHKTISPGTKVATMARFDSVLGLDLTPELAVRHVSAGPAFVEPTLEQSALLTKRAIARTKKDWAAADKIRKSFESQGLVIVDGADGSRLRKK